jgi:hypothetical protein
MRRQELLDLLREGGLEKEVAQAEREEGDKIPDVLVRVVFRRPGQADPFAWFGTDPGKEVVPGFVEHDWVVPVRGKLVLAVAPWTTAFLRNEDGDEWKQAIRKKLAKVFPAIRVPD